MRRGTPPAEAQVLAVVLHGRYGAPEMMVEHLVDRLAAPGVHYVLPRAAGEMWYTAKTTDPLTAATREELAAACAQVETDIDAALEAGAPAERLVVIGFSQGACLALELALARGAWRGALCSLTGCRVGQEGDGRPVTALKGMPIYMSNGDADPFITFPSFVQTMRTVAAAGARLRCDVFPGREHVMSKPEIATVDAVLRAVGAGREAFEPIAA